MKINLQKLTELVPNTEEVCHRYIIEYHYYELCEKDNKQNRIRYIDILACLLGSIGSAGVDYNYIVKQNKSNKSYIELEIIKKVYDHFYFVLYEDLQVEPGSSSYEIDSVVKAYEFLKEFNLLN